MNLQPCRSVALKFFLTILAMLVPAAQAQSSSGQFEVMETSIDQVHAAMASGSLTAHQLVQMYLDRIAAYDKSGPKINCVITINPDALAEADRLDAEYKKGGFVGPLHGIPILVKDQVDAAGMPTTLGTVLFKDYNPPLDSFVVAKLKKAGAIMGNRRGDAYALGDVMQREPDDQKSAQSHLAGAIGGADRKPLGQVMQAYAKREQVRDPKPPCGFA